MQRDGETNTDDCNFVIVAPLAPPLSLRTRRFLARARVLHEYRSDTIHAAGQ